MSFLGLAETKEFLQVGYSEQDTFIQTAIDAAEEYVEEYCGLKLSQASRVDLVDGGGRSLWPPGRPVASVSLVEIVKDASNTDTVNASTYRLVKNQIIFDNNQRWFPGRSNYQITYVGGYAAGTVPAGLKGILLDMVRRFFDNRGGKQVQSAAGFGVTWTGFFQTDFARRLKAYRLDGGI